jgi:hypothetical protein
VGFPLRCFQRLSRPSMATRRVPLARQPGHQRLVPPGPLVLGRAPLKPPAPAADRDRPVSRTIFSEFPRRVDYPTIPFRGCRRLARVIDCPQGRDPSLGETPQSLRGWETPLLLKKRATSSTVWRRFLE